MMETTFYYLISSEAGLAHDQQGNHAPCYMTVTLELKPLNEGARKTIETETVGVISRKLGLSAEHIIPVTRKKYEESLCPTCSSIMETYEKDYHCRECGHLKEIKEEEHE